MERGEELLHMPAVEWRSKSSGSTSKRFRFERCRFRVFKDAQAVRRAFELLNFRTFKPCIGSAELLRYPNVELDDFDQILGSAETAVGTLAC